jgi:hypothetical protein
MGLLVPAQSLVNGLEIGLAKEGQSVPPSGIRDRIQQLAVHNKDLETVLLMQEH